jgi:hypothetical protein
MQNNEGQKEHRAVKQELVHWPWSVPVREGNTKLEPESKWENQPRAACKGSGHLHKV